jgi:hypothetical protein
VQYAVGAGMLTNWNVSSLNSGLTCSIFYAIYLTTFTYVFSNRLVGDDYVYQTVSLSMAHYQLKMRFTVAFVGVWGTNIDYLWMHLNDTLQTYDVNMSYSCALTSTGTDPICGVTMPTFPNAYNQVDCLQTYDYTYSHNTTSMLVNITYPNLQRDASVRFWNLYDALIVIATCHAACAQCFGAANTQCTSCANGYYYLNNNTCLAACPGSYLLLINPFNALTGQCLSACPQGYYASGASCLACSSGCLACTSASSCSVSSTPGEETLWSRFVEVWVIVLILGILLSAGIIWRIFCFKSAVASEEMQRLPGEVRKESFDERTVQETM